MISLSILFLVLVLVWIKMPRKTFWRAAAIVALGCLIGARILSFLIVSNVTGRFPWLA
jgi:hypothetical protein